MDALEIIKLQERLEARDSTFRSTWQETADYIFPRENSITRDGVYGQRRGQELYDVTAILAADDMTSGLVTYLIPAGQKFFALSTSDAEVAELDIVKSYMAKATEIIHEELYSSNFRMQVTETLHSLHVFGTGNIFSEWRNGLNFMDWDISRYQMLENAQGEIDTMVLKFPLTARQAFKKWGQMAGKSVVEIFADNGDPKKAEDVMWFIHIVRPRENRNPRLEDTLNMPFESGYISVKDKVVISESGYEEFPYHTPRWSKTSGETHGRGIGTKILPQVKVLQGMVRDLVEVANKNANPHREVLSTFEGEYDTTPGGRNDVTDLPSSYVDPNNFGSFPVNKDIVEMQRQLVRQAFFDDAFAPVTGLTGDRRNELEIQQRIQEAFRRVGSPIGRIETELFTPLITRSYMLLVRNGRIQPAPEVMRDQNIKVVYRGLLSLAQQDAEVRASQQWIAVVGEMEAIMPGSIDNIDQDDAIRRIGRALGVNEEDIASMEQVKAKREERRAELERQQALEAAQVAAGAYGQTTKAPEEGSAAEVIGAM